MSSQGLFVLFVVAGLLLSLNPFSLSVFLALLAGALGKGHPRRQLRIISLSYMLSYALVIALVGMLLAKFISLLPTALLNGASLVIALIAILLGLLFVKNYFLDKPHFGLAKYATGAIHKHTVKRNSPESAVRLGVIAASAALSSIGVQVLALATIVALVRPDSPHWLILLPLALLLPLAVILGSVVDGTKISAIIKWKNDGRNLMYLSIGLVHILLGWAILLILNGTIGRMI